MVSCYFPGPEAFNIKVVKTYPEMEMDEEERFADLADRSEREGRVPKKADTKGWAVVVFFISLSSVCPDCLFKLFSLLVGGWIRSEELIQSGLNEEELALCISTIN
jgi:hypothetical protein